MKSRQLLSWLRAVAVTGVLLATANPAIRPVMAEVVYPKGSRIGLEAPPRMELDPRTMQFVDTAGKAAIAVIELPPQAYPDIEKKIFAEATPAGVTMVKRESFPFASGIGFYAAARVVIDGVAYRKSTLLLSVPGMAAVVSFEMPESEMQNYPEDVVRRTLASVTVRNPPIEERLGLIPFVVSDFGGFKVSDVLPAAVLLTEPDRPDGWARVVISIGRGAPDQPDERARFARNLLQNAQLPELSIVSGEAMRIRGTAGFEIKAVARDANGIEASVVQWVRFGGGGYLIILAVAPKSEWDSLYPRFRAVRDGIEPR